eukprot:scaffold16168_cov110-Isochrysis_galbana.AAC.8
MSGRDLAHAVASADYGARPRLARDGNIRCGHATGAHLFAQVSVHARATQILQNQLRLRVG